MKKNAALSPRELRRTLNYLILSYSLGVTFILAVTGAPLTGFIRLLTKNDLTFSIIMAIPTLGAVFQIFGSFYIERTGRRWESFFFACLVQRAIWIPITLIPLLYFKVSPTTVLIIITILMVVFAASGHFADLAFSSYYSSIVPREIAGRYRSKRAAIVTAVGAVGSILVGKYLGDSPTFFNFAVMFGVVSILGIIDVCLSSFAAHHPPMLINEEKISFFKLFSLPFKNKNYFQFIIFGTVWAFGVNISAIFINVYLLENLAVSYLMISILNAFVVNSCSILAVRFWGRLADNFGNKPVLKVAATFATLIPFLWLLPSSSENKYLFIIPAFIVSGLAWSGVELSIINLSMWLAPEKNRTIYMATYALTSLILGVALSSIVGGLIMQTSGPILDSIKIPFINNQYFNKFHLLFLISLIIRFLSSQFILKKVKEESSKSVKEMITYVFDIITFKRARETIRTKRNV